MGPNAQLVLNSNQRGDAVYRDAYVRGLTLSDTGDVQQGNYYIDAGGYSTCVSAFNTSYDTVADTGSWSCHVKSTGVTLDTSTAVPQLYITPTQTTFSSSAVEVDGTLQVNNYSIFHDDVDIPQGNVSIGQSLTVDGGIAASPSVVVNEGLYTLTTRGNSIDFTDTWRISYDATKEGLVFQEKVAGVYTTRAYIDSSGLTNGT